MFHFLLESGLSDPCALTPQQVHRPLLVSSPLSLTPASCPRVTLLHILALHGCQQQQIRHQHPLLICTSLSYIHYF